MGLSGNTGLIGAPETSIGGNSGQGATYLYRGLDTAAGTVTPSASLIASDGAEDSFFGESADASGNIGLVGAYYATVEGNSAQGAAYVYRSLDTIAGTVTQDAKLISSDGASGDSFGFSVSSSGNSGLVGAYNATVEGNSGQGAAYLYRGLDTATGTVIQNAKLISSDGASNDNFGVSSDLLGTTGLVGALNATVTGNVGQGAAYLYRSLDTATGTVAQNAKLVASDGTQTNYFGNSVSLSGNTGLVGAYFATVEGNSQQGAAYFYRNLDTATGVIPEDVKLISSDGAMEDRFGFSVSVSGNTGLVGAIYARSGSNSYGGAAYLYRNLDTATETITENLKITASDDGAFGSSVSLSGDNFVIGAPMTNPNGKAYTGSVSSITTLDTGTTGRVISKISFVSKDNWIIGLTTDENEVTLSAGDSATVTATGKVVEIGGEAGSDNNMLDVAGKLVATTVAIGSLEGNVGNTLKLEDDATFTIESILLSAGNFLSIEGDYTNTVNLLSYLDTSALKVWDGGWLTVTAGNAGGLISSEFSGGYTTIQTIPEPGTWVLLGLGCFVILYLRQGRRLATRLHRGKSATEFPAG